MNELEGTRHKETFFQAGEEGIPSHWVVQFYVDGSAFPEAAYFSTEKEARELEEALCGDPDE